MTAELQWLAAESDPCSRRVMLVYAHPDDEAIAVGGRLRLLRDALFVQVTDGAPRDEADSRRLGLTRAQYREQREREVCAALRAGGAPAARRVRLGFVDKEAALHLREFALRLEALLQQERPEVVLTHAFEGGHADHDACAWVVRAAADRCAWRPLVVESPFYHESDEHQSDEHESGEHERDEPAGGVFRSGSFRNEAGEELRCALSEAARARKGAMFAAHGSQAEVLRGFAIEEERFRVAPQYDFAEPLRRAWYERFIEGMTAERFARLAQAAEQQLRTGVAA